MWHRVWAGLIRQVRLLVVLTAITLVAGVGWSYLSGLTPNGSAAEPMAAGLGPDHTPAAWGDEVLTDLSGRVVAALPVRVANACGLGASSCFRCHNGKRAPAPGEDTARQPWHADHKKVNNSCGGCHQGNPRLMKQSIAHKGLIANPVADPGEACVGCHSTGDAQGMVDTYRKLTDTTGE